MGRGGNRENKEEKWNSNTVIPNNRKGTGRRKGVAVENVATETTGARKEVNEQQ